MDQINPVRFYKLPEVAEILHLTDEKVRELVNTGQLASKRFYPNAHALVLGQWILDFMTPAPAGQAVANG